MKIDGRTTEGKKLLERVRFDTRMSQHRIEEKIKEVSKIILDGDAEHRLKSCQCKRCYYSNGFAGQAFTNYICQICKKECTHHNTATPDICDECARDNHLCKFCMAELQYDTTADQRRYSAFNNQTG